MTFKSKLFVSLMIIPAFFAFVSCGKSKTKKEIKDTETVNVDSYKDPDYTWVKTDTGYNCIAKAENKNNSSKSITEIACAKAYVSKEATCTTKGVDVYVAEFKNSLFSVQSKNVDVEVKQHDYDIDYIWSGYDSVQATAICKDCSNKKTETATSNISINHKYCYDLIKYEAVFKDSIFKTQEKYTQDSSVSILHKYDYTGHCTNEGCEHSIAIELEAGDAFEPSTKIESNTTYYFTTDLKVGQYKFDYYSEGTPTYTIYDSKGSKLDVEPLYNESTKKYTNQFFQVERAGKYYIVFNTDDKKTNWAKIFHFCTNCDYTGTCTLCVEPNNTSPNYFGGESSYSFFNSSFFAIKKYIYNIDTMFFTHIDISKFNYHLYTNTGTEIQMKKLNNNDNSNIYYADVKQYKGNVSYITLIIEKINATAGDLTYYTTGMGQINNVSYNVNDYSTNPINYEITVPVEYMFSYTLTEGKYKLNLDADNKFVAAYRADLSRITNLDEITITGDETIYIDVACNSIKSITLTKLS